MLFSVRRPRDVNLRTPALILVLAAPLGLLHAFLLAEICIGLTDILFVAEMARQRNFAWARRPWFIAAMLWWLWLLICSAPFGFTTAGWFMSFAQAFVIIRFIVFTAALESWVLTTRASRRAAAIALGLSCLWIGLESWQQYLTGSNIFGDPRWADGALTGPFWKPRAGALYAHLLFIGLIPAAMALLARGRAGRFAAAALIVLGVVTSVLIGQRMGTAYTLLGDATMALLIPRLRRAALIAFAAAIVVTLLTPLISPPTHAKLVLETGQNMGHFTASPYGQLMLRAVTMGLNSPWHGWGYNGFRAFCPQPRFATGFGLPPTQLSLGACNLHPHNYYLQAFTDAGFPGLFLFIILNAIWLFNLFRGLPRNPDAWRAGLFIAALTFAWPFGSTDEFPTLYMPGWMFLILGLGLALRRSGVPDPA